VRFQVLRVARMKISILWDIALCSLIRDHTAQQPRRRLSSLYSRRSFTQNVWDLTCSRLTVFPEFRYKSKRAQLLKKDVLAYKVWYEIKMFKKRVLEKPFI
jgi:hypothetical protein